jgi:iron complex outermembrane receptor protein
VAANTRVYYGVEGYRDSIASNNLGRHERARGAAYVGVDARALHRFSLNAGVRDEVYGSFNHELSPMVSGGFWLNGRIKVRASMSRAFRLPTYTDLYYHDPSNVGSPDLRPEKAWSYEGGIDWNHSGRFRAELTVFQRRERDGIDYVRATAVDVWRATNFQRLRFTGVEAGLTTRIANEHRIDVRYTDLHGAQTLLTGLESKYAFNYPIHSGLVSVHSVWGGQLMTRVRAGVLERFGRNPYGVVDLYAARATGNWRPFAQITNLTDTAFEEILGVAMPGRGFLAGIEVIVFPSR